MAPRNHLTDKALEGYKATSSQDRCPYFATSDSSAAWHIGRDLAAKKHGIPAVVSASRGYSYNVVIHGRRMKAFIDWSKNPVAIRWENAS